MDKETLKYNMERLERSDQVTFLNGFLAANDAAVKDLASRVHEDDKTTFKPDPGEGTGDIEFLEYLSKRGTVMRAILREVETQMRCEDFVGMEHLADLVTAYHKSTASEDLGEKRKSFCAVKAQLVQAVIDLVELRNWKFQDDLQEAKIKALIELFPG